MSLFDLSFFEQRDIANLVVIFPDAFALAQADWAKFKISAQQGLMSPDEMQTVLDWYRDFPRLWDTIRPNWAEPDPRTGLLLTYRVQFAQRVDAWVDSLKSDRVYQKGLGIAPLIIAGILIAVAAGITGAAWAVGYLKKQANISKLIDETVAGHIPPEVLKSAIEAEQSPDFFSEISGLIKWAVIGVVAVVALPTLIGLIPKGGAHASR